MLRAIYRIIKYISICLGAIMCAVIALFYYCGRDLPDHEFLQHYKPPEGSRIYDNNHELYRELISEHRIFVPIHEIPPQLIKAFLAAEDKNFYYHPGVDIFGLLRAVVLNTLHGKWYAKPVGASTITQQVAKNFLVGNDQSFMRKVREAIMSMRIEGALSKDRILELYFNQIYLGMRSYGVAAAAYTYFQKSLHELTLVECAFLASLPKAPANYHPIKEQKKALIRRNATLRRLAEEGEITYESAQELQNEPLNVSLAERLSNITYASEEIRRELMQRFKDGAVYQEGYSIYTSLDTNIQEICERSLRFGLELYDKRHGYRGALFQLTPIEMKMWQQSLATKINTLGLFPKDRKNDIAVVLRILKHGVEIGFANGHKGEIKNDSLALSNFSNIKKNTSKKSTQIQSHLREGDCIVTTRVTDSSGLKSMSYYMLDQIPQVTGAAVVMDADTGEIIAMTGGYSIDISQFNCATQAIRQPGSSFKPFVYLAALELGYKRDSIIDDSPIEVVLGPGLGIYAPKNSTRKSLGPTPLYLGIEQSVNQMTVRLAHQIGMEHVQNMAKRLGISDNMPAQLAMSLGAGGTTLLKMTAAYASIANSGKRVFPHFIKRINDRNGHLIFQMPPAFNDHLFEVNLNHQNVLKDQRFQAIESQYTDQMQDMLRGVVMRGNAKQINYLRERYGVDIGGKTGTTNDYKDAWFVGFIRFPSNKTWIVGTFVGFSTPKSLGEGEGGGRAAVPIFESFAARVANLHNIKKESINYQ
jgi:penicillin-binding protein 1A